MINLLLSVFVTVIAELAENPNSLNNADDIPTRPPCPKRSLNMIG